MIKILTEEYMEGYYITKNTIVTFFYIPIIKLKSKRIISSTNKNKIGFV